MKPTRAALYARCSTGHQDVGLQLDALRRLAETRGWAPVEVYVDEGVSGAKDSRPALDRMMADARSGKLDVVAVWKFDRFARSTEIRQVGAGSSPVRSGGTSRAFPVDNTQAVLDELGSSQFPYAQGSNSCIHALCRAAIAGGAYLPSTGSGQTAAVKAATGAR